MYKNIKKNRHFSYDRNGQFHSTVDGFVSNAMKGGEFLPTKVIQKRFPATVTIEEGVQTFLHDKKIDAELYALLQQYSFPVDGATVVKKSNLPK